MNRSTSAAIAVAVAGWLASAAATQAAVVININEVGPDVVATASGTLSLSGLTNQGNFGAPEYNLGPASSFIEFGTQNLTRYAGFSGSSGFGTGVFGLASATSGGFMLYSKGVQVPVGFTSGSAVAGMDTFANSSFASLGLTPGQYVYSSTGDTVTINVGPQAGVPPVSSAAPEPASWALMLGGVGLMGGMLRRRSEGRVAES